MQNISKYKQKYHNSYAQRSSWFGYSKHKVNYEVQILSQKLNPFKISTPHQTYFQKPNKFQPHTKHFLKKSPKNQKKKKITEKNFNQTHTTDHVIKNQFNSTSHLLLLQPPTQSIQQFNTRYNANLQCHLLFFLIAFVYSCLISSREKKIVE